VYDSNILNSRRGGGYKKHNGGNGMDRVNKAYIVQSYDVSRMNSVSNRSRSTDKGGISEKLSMKEYIADKNLRTN